VRKTIRGIVIALTSVALSVSTNNAIAEVRIGASCSKVKQAAVINGARLECVKVGSRLNWRESYGGSTKGASATPARGKTNGYIYRYVGEKQQRLSINGAWQELDRRKESQFDPIRVAAYKAIRNAKQDASHSNIEFEFLFRPSFPVEISNLIKLESTQVARALSPHFKEKIKIKVVGITEKDKSYLQSGGLQLFPDGYFGNSLPILDSYGSLDNFYSRGGTGGGIAYFWEEKKLGIYLSHTSSLAKPDTYWPEVVAHELSHVLQWHLLGESVTRFGEGRPESKVHGHLVEGSANTLGMALGFAQLGWYSDEMDRILARDLQQTGAGNNIKTVADATRFIKEIETREGEIKERFSYSAGQVVWEYFIAKYGFDTYLKFLDNSQDTYNFDENLMQVIGKTKEQFYQEAGEYLLRVFKRLKS
jgi:hypothetical protein